MANWGVDLALLKMVFTVMVALAVINAVRQIIVAIVNVFKEREISRRAILREERGQRLAPGPDPQEALSAVESLRQAASRVPPVPPVPRLMVRMENMNRRNARPVPMPEPSEPLGEEMVREMSRIGNDLMARVSERFVPGNSNYSMSFRSETTTTTPEAANPNEAPAEPPAPPETRSRFDRIE